MHEAHTFGRHMGKNAHQRFTCQLFAAYLLSTFQKIQGSWFFFFTEISFSEFAKSCSLKVFSFHSSMYQNNKQVI